MYLIIIYILYIISEATYNALLLSTVSNPAAGTHQLHMLEAVGKTLVGLGTGLFIYHFIEKYTHKLSTVKKFTIIPLSFFAWVVLVFISLTNIFNYVLDSLSPQHKAEGIFLSVYREMALKNEIQDEVINIKKNGQYIAALGSVEIITREGVSGKLKNNLRETSRKYIGNDKLYELYKKACIPEEEGYKKAQKLCNEGHLKLANLKEEVKSKVKSEIGKKFTEKTGLPYGMSKEQLVIFYDINKGKLDKCNEGYNSSFCNGVLAKNYLSTEKKIQEYSGWNSKPINDILWNNYEKNMSGVAEKANKIVNDEFQKNSIKITNALQKVCVSREEFHKNYLQYTNALKNKKVFTGIPELGIPPVTLSSFKPGMSYEAFKKKENDIKNNIINKLVPTEKELSTYKKKFLRDADAGIFIPPISMALSAASVLLNFSILIISLNNSRKYKAVVLLAIVALLVFSYSTVKLEGWLSNNSNILWIESEKIEHPIFMLGDKVIHTFSIKL